MPADARWDKIEAFFDAALEQPPEERRAWLARACDDDELRREVEGMVAAHEKTAGILERTPAEIAPTRTLPPAGETKLRPRDVGPYRLLGPAGRGGMGIVYRAHDPRLDRDVALKFLPRHPIDRDAVKRFLVEAKAASALDHPNICTIYDVGETEDGQLFIAMVYYEGETLAERIARGPLAVGDAVELAVQVAEGLARAHAAGIVHRDVKPANLMLPAEVSPEHRRRDRVKILDFGIAKLEGSTLTRSGATPGTLAYMSPEQLDGAAVDHRSDLWSLGVVLYEMLAGRPPFAGETPAALIRSILSAEPRTIRSLRPEVPVAVERVVGKALSKLPEDRHASADELAAELDAASRELASLRASPPAGLPRPLPLRHRLLRWAAVVALVLAVLVGGWRIVVDGPVRPPADIDSAPAVSLPEASVAVLYFENLSGDAELDWLRHGLTDMLVTDLSQSPEIRVLSTDRLYQILTDLGRLDERVTSSELVREVARRGRVETVVVGSFARLGETIRVSIKVRDAASGEVAASEKIDARGEDELFSRVDQLSRALRLGFELPAVPETVAERDLGEVTTTSVEAYRHYVEADQLHRQGREHEAIALLEKAVALDAGFAMALAKLSKAYENLSHQETSREYARRAVDHADRLSGPERAYVESRYLAGRVETWARAVDILEQAVASYPHDPGLRAELAALLVRASLDDRAIEHLELLRRVGPGDAGLYDDLARVYSHCGDLASAFRVIDEGLRRFPQSFRLHRRLAWFLSLDGRFDEAEAALDDAEILRPMDGEALVARWQLRVVRGAWDGAQALLARFRRLDAPWFTYSPLYNQAVLLLYRGRSHEAVELLERFLDGHADSGTDRLLAEQQVASVLLEIGRPERALEHLRKARGMTAERYWSGNLLELEVGVNQALGRGGEAERAAAEYGRIIEAVPGGRARGSYHMTMGAMALARGELDRARGELERADAVYPDYFFGKVVIWFDLACVHRRAGRDDAAAELFRRVIESHNLRVYWPLRYVRSLYFLGRIHEERGEVEATRDSYRRFVDLWGDGDLDRDRVESARRFLAGPRSQRRSSGADTSAAVARPRRRPNALYGGATLYPSL